MDIPSIEITTQSKETSPLPPHTDSNTSLAKQNLIPSARQSTKSINSMTIQYTPKRQHQHKTPPVYKTLKVDPSTIPSSSIPWSPVVSFDSIPLILNTEDHPRFHTIDYDSDYSEEDIDQIDPNVEMRGRSMSPYRSRSPYRSLSPGTATASSRARSPSPYNPSGRDGSGIGSAGVNSINGALGIAGMGIGLGSITTLDGFMNDGYPTTPTIRSDSFLQTKQTPGFHTYVKENGKRVVVCYITGRRHSWVALDYLIDKIIRSGDQLVVISRIPEDDYKEFELLESPFRKKQLKELRELMEQDEREGNREGRTRSRRRETSKERRDRHLETKERIEFKQIHFKEVVDDLMTYIELLLPPKIEIKITIDFFLSSSTFSVLDEAVDIYNPTLFAITTKPNLRFSRTNTWNTSRISDRLVKLFNIPIMVVPSLTMNEFEIELFENLSNKKKIKMSCKNDLSMLAELDKTYSTNPSFTSFKSHHKSHHKSNHNSANTSISGSLLHSKRTTQSPLASPLIRSEDSSIISDVSSSDEDGDDDNSSDTASVKQLTRSFTNYKSILDSYLEEINDSTINQNKDIFHNKFLKILDITKKMSFDFEDYSNKDSGEGAELVRSLTQLPKLSKAKSMLDDFDDFESEQQLKINKLKTSLNSTTSLKNKNNGNRPVDLMPSKSASLVPTTSSISKSNRSERSSFSIPGSAKSFPRLIKFSSDVKTPHILKQSSANSTSTKSSRDSDDNIVQIKTLPNVHVTDFENDRLSPIRSFERNLLSKSISAVPYIGGPRNTNRSPGRQGVLSATTSNSSDVMAGTGSSGSSNNGGGEGIVGGKKKRKGSFMKFFGRR